MTYSMSTDDNKPMLLSQAMLLLFGARRRDSTREVGDIPRHLEILVPP